MAESGTADAPPVLLVHGWGASIYMWRDWFAPLAASGHHVVAMDLPGHGLSDKPGEEGRYRLESLVAAVREVIARVGLQRPHVVAQSMGGTIGLELAVSGRPPLGRLVLVNPACFAARAALDRGSGASSGLWRSDAHHDGRHRPVLGTVAVPGVRAGDAASAPRVHVDATFRVGDGAAPPYAPPADLAAARGARHARPARARCALVCGGAPEGGGAARDLRVRRRRPRGERGTAAGDARTGDRIPRPDVTSRRK
ncbi:MAG: hypothetical protein DMD35_03320 [Gemmatimonadetes bacterium]|nr:MAG: hypothetical protein DMD35_03320 [Gemmatimonadota bacterium]